jgi:hypothetical protein
MEIQKGLAEQSLPLTGEGMQNLTKKTHMALDKKLKHTSASSDEYF